MQGSGLGSLCDAGRDGLEHCGGSSLYEVIDGHGLYRAMCGSQKQLGDHSGDIAIHCSMHMLGGSLNSLGGRYNLSCHLLVYVATWSCLEKLEGDSQDTAIRFLLHRLP